MQYPRHSNIAFVYRYMRNETIPQTTKGISIKHGHNILKWYSIRIEFGM